MFKKGQVEIKEMLITIVLAGVLFIVGLLIFSNVSNSAESILDSIKNTVSNESITITSDSSTVVNETIDIVSQVGTLVFGGVSNLAFFGNASNNTNLADVIVGEEVNFTRSGGIVLDAEQFPADGEYNVTYTFESNSTGTTANTDVTSVTFFGSGNLSTDTAGIDLNDEVNFSSDGTITLSALNFTAADPYNITYDHDSDSAAQITSNNLQSTVLDSFSLGVIALIVLAAVAILAILFKLGSQ